MMRAGENIFKTGLAWKVFNETEKEFVSFLDVVPFVPKHENVFSFKLFNLIISIGSHIDNIFKAMSRYQKYQNINDVLEIVNSDRPNIYMYRKAFEPIYYLSSKKIYVKKEPIISIREYYSNIIPFYRFNKRSPNWWDVYNELKHSWFEGDNIYKANISNTLRALSALFLLIIRHEESWNKLVDYGVIIAGNFNAAEEYKLKSHIIEAFDAYKNGTNKPPDMEFFSFVELWAESKLFIYRFPFWQRWLTTKKDIKNMKPWIYRQFYAPLKF
ncbi:MAG: hypothetical protein ACFFDN_41075 [Candidatus Hodarchaeota archaeon]